MRLILKVLLPALLLCACMGMANAEDEPQETSVPLPVAEFDLAVFQGQVVLVDFWASWCEPCRHSLPWLNEMQVKYQDQGLQVVMVNLDKNYAAAEKMAADISGSIVQFQDPAGELATLYELEGMPSSYLYDRSGNLVSDHVGFHQKDEPKLEQAILTTLTMEDE